MKRWAYVGSSLIVLALLLAIAEGFHTLWFLIKIFFILGVGIAIGRLTLGLFQRKRL